MSDQDPLRHWNGQNWLRWNGTQWEPESGPSTVREPQRHDIGPALPVRERMAEGRRSRGSRRTLVAIGVGGIVVVGVILGIVASNGGGSGAPTTRTTTSGGTTSTAQGDCAGEANVAVDVWVNEGDGTLLQAIGADNRLFQKVLEGQQVYSHFVTDESTQGTSYAEQQIVDRAIAACGTAGNPLVTHGQVNTLEGLVSGNDLSILEKVTHFAD